MPLASYLYFFVTSQGVIKRQAAIGRTDVRAHENGHLL